MLHSLRSFALPRFFRNSFVVLLLALTADLYAQPDSLYVPDVDGRIHPFAVVYPPLRDTVHFVHIGHYAHDPARMAVRMTYKRGKPSGIFRAYYPDGAPLIFAIYGWGSLHGDWTEYAPDGTIILKGQYRNGKRDGTWAFRKEGVVGKYREGQMHGIWKYYENGRQVRRAKYYKGVLKKGSVHEM